LILSLYGAHKNGHVFYPLARIFAESHQAVEKAMLDWMHVRLLLMLAAIGLFVVAMLLVELWTRHREHSDRHGETAEQPRGALQSQPCASCESFDLDSKSAERLEQHRAFKRAA